MVLTHDEVRLQRAPSPCLRHCRSPPAPAVSLPLQDLIGCRVSTTTKKNRSRSFLRKRRVEPGDEDSLTSFNLTSDANWIADERSSGKSTCLLILHYRDIREGKKGGEKEVKKRELVLRVTGEDSQKQNYSKGDLVVHGIVTET